MSSATTALAAFEAFAAVERGKALKYTASWVGAETAQDIVQDALTVVWQKWDTLTNRSGYLYRTCRQLAFGEYEARGRGPVLVAEVQRLQDVLHRDDDRDEPPRGTGMLNLVVELTSQNWSRPHTAVVGLHLAEGRSRAETAEIIGVPLSEVHCSARELRRYYKARGNNPGPTTEQHAYTPHGLVMQAMRRLSRREREVMALAALGLKPQLIAPLIGISTGSARTTLCHARKAAGNTIGLAVDKDAPEAVDRFIGRTLDAVELLDLLPRFPQKTAAFQWAALEDRALGISDSLVPAVKGRTSERQRRAVIVALADRIKDHYRYGQNGLTAYLAMISKVIAVAREGLEVRGRSGASGVSGTSGTLSDSWPVPGWLPAPRRRSTCTSSLLPGGGTR